MAAALIPWIISYFIEDKTVSKLFIYFSFYFYGVEKHE